jgi:hypothetical protein
MMSSINVALKGPSSAEVQARLQQIAREAEVDLRPLYATASFTAGAPVSTYEMTTTLHAPSLTDGELRARLEPYVDETADPEVAVRFVLLP